MIVLDTMMWVWFVQGDRSLPVFVMQEADGAVISAVSVWEVCLLVEKGRLETGHSPGETIRQWLARYPFRVIPLNEEIAVLSRELAFEHDDPADRFIAATAHKLGAELATSDARLLRLPWLKTIS